MNQVPEIHFLSGLLLMVQFDTTVYANEERQMGAVFYTGFFIGEYFKSLGARATHANFFKKIKHVNFLQHMPHRSVVPTGVAHWLKASVANRGFEFRQWHFNFSHNKN